MERNNEASLYRQRQRRERNDFLEGLVDPVTRQNVDDRLDQFKEYQSSGRIFSTEGRFGTRAVKEEIERLEEYKQQEKDRRIELDKALEEDRQRGGAGQDASRDTGDAMPTIEERERDAGLFNTTTGRGLDDPTMEERERDAGLVTGIRPSPVPTERDFPEEQGQPDGELDIPVEEPEDQMATFGVILCINGNPHSASIYGQIGPKLET